MSPAPATPLPRTPLPPIPGDDAVVHVGGPTVVLDYAGARIVTDPTFDPAGTRYRRDRLGYRKLTDPAIAADDLGRVDAVLLSHEGHPDNLDTAGRAVIARVLVARTLATRTGAVITTPAGARRLPGAIPLRPWQTATIEAPGGAPITVTATPARHAPFPLSLLAGPVTGFLVSSPGHPTVYISGDNVSRRAVRRVASRVTPDVAILHAGAPRFRATGPVRFCMTAAQAARAAITLGAARVLVIHSEGWSHFSEAADDVDAAFASPGLRAVRVAAGLGERVVLEG